MIDSDLRARLSSLISLYADASYKDYRTQLVDALNSLTDLLHDRDNGAIVYALLIAHRERCFELIARGG